MVETRQPRVPTIEFTSRRHPGTPVEVVERSELVGRSDQPHLLLAHRPTFDLFVVVRSGAGTHQVDFQEIPIQPGRMVRVRPGQMQRWNLESDFDASIVLSRHAPDAPQTWFPGDAAYADVGVKTQQTVTAIVDALRREQTHFAPGEPSIRLMTSLFSSLCAAFDDAADVTQPEALPEAFIAFRSAIEAGLSRSHRVSDYVAGLGFSRRTVDRACMRSVGRSAKAVLDDRLVLESKRLLAHTNDPAAAIAAELGFSEPTNFQKFFLRMCGQRPGEFRRASRE